MAFDPKLGNLFFFEATDLEANRHLQLSEEQARGFAHLEKLNRRHARRILPIFGFLLVVALVLAFVGSAMGPTGISRDTFVALGVAGVMVLFMVSLVAFFGRRTRRDEAVRRAGQVLVTQGPVEYDPSWDGYFGIDIGGVRFPAELLQYQALSDTATYRAYYLATEPTAMLLSFEQV